MINYIVAAKKPNAHLFNITMEISSPEVTGQKVSLPNWTPGSYLLREYARHLITIEAYSASTHEKINIKKITSNTWICENTPDDIIINYTIYAWKLTMEDAYIDQNRAFFNGCALFLFAHQKEQERCRIKILPPNCPKAKFWQVATSLLPDVETPLWGFGDYYASSYQDLIDRPVSMGVFEIFSFKVMNVSHYIVFSGKHDGDLKRLVKDVAVICDHHLRFFATPPPFDCYTFQVAVLEGDEIGGLEHSFASALMIERESLPILNDPSKSQEYIYLLSLFSHEYFHAWNVKRIKPESFMHYDLDEKVYTTQLWAFEGITSYYGNLALIRTNLISHRHFLDLLSQTVTKLLRTPGRLKQTLADSSFDAWIKYNIPDEYSINAGVNYYVKGELVGLIFDLALRLKSGNTKTLDDVMRQLWIQYGMRGIGVPEGKIDQMIIELGGQQLTELVYEALYTTKELPIAEFLTQFGYTFELHSVLNQKKHERKGLGVRAHQKSSFKQGILGCSTFARSGRVYVSHVIDDSAASIAGISARDEIVAINGIRVDNFSMERITKRLTVGQTIIIHVFRQDTLHKLRLILTDPPLDIAKISMKKNITSEEKNNIELWIK